MYVLGLWDGHDSGAALLEGDKILFAANEERYTKRKLEVRFPYNSISEALRFAGLKPSDIEVVSFPTTELTKTISRVFPWQKDSYYMFRRRKTAKPRFESLMHYTKYAMTSIGPLPLCGFVSKAAVRAELRRMGFSNFKLHTVDHHAAHAATAAFTSGMNRSLVITLDGLGDGLSGSVSTFRKGRLRRERTISARNSLGVFFEQVTNIIGMRELEDEGKVMAMADYSFPFPFSKNKLGDFFTVNGTDIKAKYGMISQYDMLARIAWQTPREQFAYMAQQLLERVVTQFVRNAMEEFGADSVALAGGVFSNVKANMMVRELPELRGWYVFPHMGDGGIALGAAMQANYALNGISSYGFGDAYLGNGYESDYIRGLLRKERGIKFEEWDDPACGAAALMEKDEYVFWFQGRMEYGPRALGNRSIVARADSETVKERLNMHVKQREWYQPFAPSVLVEDAARCLYFRKAGSSRFMTMAYRVHGSAAEQMRSAMHVDRTARPQVLGQENQKYRKLIEAVKEDTGYGVVLNTSLNIHGMPIVASPEGALRTMKATRTRHMFIGDYHVENTKL